ncbi:MAG: glycerol dehydrogenase [Chloroflexota bacterium]
MIDKSTYSHQDFFANQGNDLSPRAMIAPARYIQGAGAMKNLGRYLGLLPARRALVLITPGGQQRFGQLIEQTLAEAEISSQICLFAGECSYEEVARVTSAVGASEFAADCLIAVGGGKCIDAGKAIAFRLDVPLAVCPTIASTDGPTSAVAVMYDEAGVSLGGEFYPQSPALVVVDSAIIAAAPPRFLAAGIADALASLYELRANVTNPQGRSMLGARTPLAVQAMVETGAEVLFRDGAAAMAAVRNNEVTAELENVIEANTLISGIGFESGGLAVVHAVAAGLTAVSSVRETFLHGELVAIGILTQLLLLDDNDEAEKVVRLFKTIGLPTCLGDLKLSLDDADAIDAVVEKAVAAPFIHHVGFTVTADLLHDALRKVNDIT